ncbi:MAG: hypothetical protein A2Z65_13575 [Gallionellales bacterium RIFCSPLOWO2_02_58_13]|nr:MAG: hypothetical protein A2Z65_13575 [Gallionellales bacterium RIFCSPLOWO2_02_58_13]
MQTTPPEVGKTYVSSKNPKIVVYVEDFIPGGIDENDGEHYGFLVECCAPCDKGDMNSMSGWSLAESDWNFYGFV